MSDRFKFRAWDGKKMITPECISFDDDIAIDDGTWPYVVGKHCVLMQCIGLKDKNRTLIYDGDAEITAEPIDDAYGESAGWLKFYRVVRWFDEIASFVIFESSEDPNMETEIMTFDHFKIVDGCITDFEVTTNVHENPELLEKAE